MMNEEAAHPELETSPAEAPAAQLPPGQVRILDLEACAEEGGQRMRIRLRLTPFQQSPLLEVRLLDPEGHLEASASIVEPADEIFEFTLHNRAGQAAAGAHTLDLRLSYTGQGEVDRRALRLQLPAREGSC